MVVLGIQRSQPPILVFFKGKSVMKTTRTINPSIPGCMALIPTRLFNAESSIQNRLTQQFRSEALGDCPRPSPLKEVLPAKLVRGCLKPWQLSRAKTMMIDQMNCGISITELANECALSRSHFSRVFKKTTGLSPRDWLQQARILYAKELLTLGQLSITNIALECGFSDQSHFIRAFTTITGQSPGKWRAAQLN